MGWQVHKIETSRHFHRQLCLWAQLANLHTFACAGARGLHTATRQHLSALSSHSVAHIAQLRTEIRGEPIRFLAESEEATMIRRFGNMRSFSCYSNWTTGSLFSVHNFTLDNFGPTTVVDNFYAPERVKFRSCLKRT